MFTKNIKDTFTTNLLNTVSGVLGEAKKKKCSEGCECEACEKTEAKEGYVPTNDAPSDKDRKVAGKLGALLKREREAKEKKEPLGVKEEAELDEAKNLTGLPKSTAEKNKQYIEVTHLLGHKTKVPVHPTNAYRALNRYRNDPSTKSARIVSEDAEQIDEISKATMGRYINRAKDQIDAASYKQGHRDSKGSGGDVVSKSIERKLSKRHGGIELAVNKLTKEEAEQIQEVGDTPAGKRALGRYIKDRRGTILGGGMDMHQQNTDKSTTDKQRYDTGRRVGNAFTGVSRAVDRLTKEAAHDVDHMPGQTMSSSAADKQMRDVHDNWAAGAAARAKGRAEAAKKKLTKEESEQIDELSKPTLGSYIKKASNQVLGKGIGGGMALARNNADGEAEGHKLVNKAVKRMSGIQKAADKLTKEEQEFIDSINDADIEQIDELSDATLKSYAKKAMDQATSAHGYQKDAEKSGDHDRARREMKHKWKRQVGARNAIDRLGNNTLAKEEVEITEARGRPRKAAAKDFTINPNTKEKLMHNNPEHMAKIEKLQKHGVLQKLKTEAGQNIMTQLQKAKTSMTGGTMVHFTHGDSKEVSGTHAAKLLDKHAGMKPNEKEAFQKKIGHSHENLKSEL
jgi:hypothetical protein